MQGGCTQFRTTNLRNFLAFYSIISLLAYAVFKKEATRVYCHKCFHTILKDFIVGLIVFVSNRTTVSEPETILRRSRPP